VTRELRLILVTSFDTPASSCAKNGLKLRCIYLSQKTWIQRSCAPNVPRHVVSALSVEYLTDSYRALILVQAASISPNNSIISQRRASSLSNRRHKSSSSQILILKKCSDAALWPFDKFIVVTAYSILIAWSRTKAFWI